MRIGGIMKSFPTSIALLLLVVSVAGASEQRAKAHYEALVRRAQLGDHTVDLNELRTAAGEACIRSNVEARKKLMTPRPNKNYQMVAEVAAAVVKSNFTDLDGHALSYFAAKELGKPEEAEFHRWVLIGLLRSLQSTGDGQSPATAMKVISVDEEYFILTTTGQGLQKQALSTCVGNPCDILTTFHLESKEKHTWYFNVEIPLKCCCGAKALEELRNSSPPK
jgi:hypothetical protein